MVQRSAFHEFVLTAAQLSTIAAIAFAERHPEQVSRVVLIDGFARMSDLLSTPHVRALTSATKADWVLAPEAIGFTVFGSGREESRDQGAYIQSCVGPNISRTPTWLQTWDVAELAHGITAPTLVLKHEGAQFVTWR